MNNFSMSEFMRLAGQANRAFSVKNRFVKSSLDPVIAKLGGHTMALPPDRRTYTYAQKLAIAEQIWQVGALDKESEWTLKKRKYADALGYLIEEILGVNRDKLLLVGEYKSRLWDNRFLRSDQFFVTRKKVDPIDVLQAGGMLPSKGTEMCVIESNGTLKFHQLTFAAKLNRVDGAFVFPRGGLKNKFDFGNNQYVMFKPRGTRYLAAADAESGGSGEAAFLDLTPLTHLMLFRDDSEADIPWTPTAILKKLGPPQRSARRGTF